MAKARKILSHVKTVKSIRTVTRTMEMVASVRFKQSHDRAVQARPYTKHLSEMVHRIISNNPKIVNSHPLLKQPPAVKPVVLLVITSNRGLCGGFNSSIMRLAGQRLQQYSEAGENIELHLVGKKGIQHFRYRKVKIAKAYSEFQDVPEYETLWQMIEEYISHFLAERISGLEVVYMQFVSAGKQKPAIVPVLPLRDIGSSVSTKGELSNYEFFPSQEELLKKLLPAMVRQRFYQCFLDSSVSEQVMRIGAMHSATESADDMIHDLSITYNRTRQSQITTELNEIMGGQVCLQG